MGLQHHYKQGNTNSSDNAKIIVRYCKEDEVLQKNRIFLMFKSQFLAKMQHINSNGHNMQLFRRISIWIENNWEELYEQMITKAKMSCSMRIGSKLHKKEVLVAMNKQQTMSLQLNDGCGQTHTFQDHKQRIAFKKMLY